MRSRKITVLAAVLLMASTSLVPVNAAGLLGGVLDIDTGDAGNDALVNVGLGSEDDTSLGVNLGDDDSDGLLGGVLGDGDGDGLLGGDLDNIHDYTLAATEASVTTQLTVAVRNQALDAFNEIMRMPIG